MSRLSTKSSDTNWVLSRERKKNLFLKKRNINYIMLRALLSVLLPLAALATYGVDVSTRVTQDKWSCLKSSYGANFAIIRVYQSNGKVDPNGAATINDARNAGIPYVDGYIFPCYSCGNPEQQMDDTINYLSASGVRLLRDKETHDIVMGMNSTQTLHSGEKIDVTSTAGMLWIDVEGTQYWSSNAQSNVDFIQGMVDEGVRQGIVLGIYTSNSQWSPIAGGSSQFASYPLWYPHYDSNPSFSDFSSFGGWNSPSVKQYQGTSYQCDVGLDMNYY